MGPKEGEIWRGTGLAANTDFTPLGGKCHFNQVKAP